MRRFLISILTATILVGLAARVNAGDTTQPVLAVRPAVQPLPAAGSIAQEDLTTARVNQVFTAAAFKTRIDDDGDLLVSAESYKWFIRADTDKKLISYFAFFRLPEVAAPDSAKLAVINGLNKKLTLVRWKLMDSGSLLAEWQVSTEDVGSITPQFLLANFRRFMKATQIGLATIPESLATK